MSEMQSSAGTLAPIHPMSPNRPTDVIANIQLHRLIFLEGHRIRVVSETTLAWETKNFLHFPLRSPAAVPGRRLLIL